MKDIDHLYHVSLTLFDGGAAAAGATGTAAGDGGTASPANGEVVYGKQTATAAQQPETKSAGDANQNPSPDDLRKEYRELMTGKFRDIYTEETQHMISKRFADMTAMQQRMEKMQQAVDIVAQRYGIEDGNIEKVVSALENDDKALKDAADAAGMSVEQFKEFQRLQRENKVFQTQRQNAIERQMQEQRAQQWYQEAMALKEKFPDFDLTAELQDRNFLASLQAGVPMELAFKGKYFDRYMQDATQFAAQQASKKAVDNIRAKGQRPAENGTAAQSAFTVKDDVHKLTRKDRAEIAKRVARGESISF